MRHRHSRQGFTLIEILVVVAIITMLASIIFAALSTARIRGRNAHRDADIINIQQALELYAGDNTGNYPLCGTVCNDAACSNPSACNTYPNLQSVTVSGSSVTQTPIAGCQYVSPVTMQSARNSMSCLAQALTPKYMGSLPQDPFYPTSSYVFDRWCTGPTNSGGQPYRLWTAMETGVPNNANWFSSTAFGVSDCAVAP